MHVPLADKSVDVEVNIYLRQIYYRFGRSRQILSDNGSQLKTSLFAEVASKPGIKHIYSSPYRQTPSMWMNWEIT